MHCSHHLTRWLSFPLRHWFVAAALCLSANTSMGSDTIKKIADSKTIVIAFIGGLSDSAAPFAMVEPGGQVKGYAIELCNRIADGIREELHLSELKVKYWPVNVNNRVDALLDNKADLECSVTTNTAERRKKVAFTIPHFFTSVRMLVRADSSIREWSDLQNHKIVVQKGNGMVNMINQRTLVGSLAESITEMLSTQECLDMLDQRKADAFVMDEVLLHAAVRRHTADPGKYLVTGTPLSVEAYAIMMRKDDPAFKQMVDRQMAKLAYRGDIKKIYDRWFMPPALQQKSLLNMPMSHLLRDLLRYPSDKVSN